MDFRILGLAPDAFRPLVGLSDAQLAEHGARRCVADAKPGFPDRIELRDAEPGETLLLLNHVHQPANTPYRASHAVFVLEAGGTTYDRVNEVPETLRIRPLSLRAFDAGHMMVDADLVDGRDVQGLIARMLGKPEVAYLHVHFARRGCYAARIERA
jgi:hypothetical protein